jgi:hypothetical protein
MLLFKDAKHQTALIRQSIADRTHSHFDAGDRGGDLATFLADGIASIMRENVTNPQTVFQALSRAVAEGAFHGRLERRRFLGIGNDPRATN